MMVALELWRQGRYGPALGVALTSPVAIGVYVYLIFGSFWAALIIVFLVLAFLYTPEIWFR